MCRASCAYAVGLRQEGGAENRNSTSTCSVDGNSASGDDTASSQTVGGCDQTDRPGEAGRSDKA